MSYSFVAGRVQAVRVDARPAVDCPDDRERKQSAKS
jgi:hypothetical protein